MNSAFWARLMIVLVFLFAAYSKIVGFSGLVDLLASKGFPLPSVAAVVAILIETVVAISFAIGYKKKWSAWILGGFTVIVTVLFHNPWATGTFDGGMMVMALKNVALLGGLWAAVMCSCDTCEPKRA